MHRVVDFAVHPWVRRVLDRRWFAPACYLGWRVNRVLWKNLLYKPIIRPLRYLRTRRPQRQAARTGQGRSLTHLNSATTLNGPPAGDSVSPWPRPERRPKQAAARLEMTQL